MSGIDDENGRLHESSRTTALASHGVLFVSIVNLIVFIPFIFLRE